MKRRSALSLGVVLSAPALIALTLMLLFGHVHWLVTPLAGGTAVLVALWIAGQLTLEVERVGTFLVDLIDSDAPPDLDTGFLTAGLTRPLRHLAMRWRARTEQLVVLGAEHRAILDLLPDPLLIVGEGPRVAEANRAAAELLGWDLVGRDLAAALRDPNVLAAADAVLAGARATQVEFAMAVPVPRDFLVQAAPVPSARPDVPLVALVLRDVTEAKRIERMRVDFVANASHEIRTPLATVAGLIETLQGPAREDPVARDRFLDTMAAQIQRMTRLVSDLLSLSRIELAEHDPPRGEVALLPLLERVARGLELRLAERGMRLEIDAGPDLPVVIGDEHELEQVFQNLLDNAVKYAGPETVIRVAARVEARMPGGQPARPGSCALAVSVTDQGPGIPRRHLPRLTERFYRTDPARSRAMGGTGLGLAIVKHIVGRHRGRLDITSEVGEGSTFTVHLPARPEV